MKPRKPIKRKSPRKILTESVLALIKAKLIKERGHWCQICGARPGETLFHIKSQGAYPRLAFYIPNLLLVCWFPCHNDWHHDFYKAKLIEKKIRGICGENYEAELERANIIQPRVNMFHLRNLKEVYLKESV